MMLALRGASFLSTIFHVLRSENPDTSACFAFRNIYELLRMSPCFKASVTNIQHGFLSTDAFDSGFRFSYSQIPLRILTKNFSPDARIPSIESMFL